MMQSSHSTSSGTQNAATSSNPDQKIRTDLATLTDQINLCQSMLAQQQASSSSSGSHYSIDGDEALLTVIGFLEACVPRMVELIESAAQGGELQPETFEECLVVNDKLTNILSDVEKDPKDRQQPIVPVAAAATAVASAATTEFGVDDSEVDHLEESMEKLGVGESNNNVPVAAGGKTTGLDNEDEDPFALGMDLLSPTLPMASDPFSATSAAALAGAAMKSNDDDDDDDFDAFFRDRTSAGGSKQD